MIPEQSLDSDCYQFARGDRVTIRGEPSGITLNSATGTVVEPDPEWDGYYLVELDAPAIDQDSGAGVERIVEAAFNLLPVADD